MSKPLRSKRLLRLGCLFALVCPILCIVLLFFWLKPNGLAYTGEIEPYLADRRGGTPQVTIDGAPEIADDHRIDYFRVHTTTGLSIPLALRRPLPPRQNALPLVVLIGGFGSGRQAVTMIDDPGDTVLAGFGYTYDGNRRKKGLEYLSALRDLRLAMHDTPAAMQAGLDYLVDLPEINPQQVEMVGVSLGAFMVCVAGTYDPRVSRVWSIHGGAGFKDILHTTLEGSVPTPLIPNLVTFSNSLVKRLDPVHHVDRIAPRPIVMINAEADAMIPRVASERLYAAAAQPKEQIWLASGHVHPSKTELIETLVTLVLTRVQEDARPPAGNVLP